MLVGPVFTREISAAGRNWRLYLFRALYVGALFAIVLTAWMILIGSHLRGVADLARFGEAVFGVLAPLQLAMAVAFSALLTASAVAQEKDRRTFDLLMMTNLTNSELVLGKLLASMLGVLVLVVAGIGLLMLVTLLGGVSFPQVARVVAVTLAAALVAGSLGSTIALWREKSFQSLALTALALVLWLIVGELVASGAVGNRLGFSVGVATGTADGWAAGVSPLRAIMEAARPIAPASAQLPRFGHPVNLFLVVCFVVCLLANLVAIARVRVWNPSRENQLQEDEWSARNVAQAGDSAASTSTPQIKSREVWDNPILWREIRTWAYGRKIIIVRIAYLVILAICTTALISLLNSPEDVPRFASLLPPATRPVVPLMLLGLVLVNALAVTSLTNERDVKALDLLLVTDLTPKEIIFGKLGGTFFNAKEMILLPIVLCCVLWGVGQLSTENLFFLVAGLMVVNAFVAVLGLHAGMTYVNSRSAIAVSLGTLLFLLLGIAICMRLMLAFEQSFNVQLQAFLAFMVGGGIGLLFALGIRNPSRAIVIASLLLPFSTFYVITSFLQGDFGWAFLVSVTAYGFATAAMLVPAVYEFDVATGRTSERDV